MNFLCIARILIIILSICLVLTGPALADGGIDAYYGETVTLQGYSYGSTNVYLFLTGPNLPVNGVALDDISARADQGYFTRVDVDDRDHWVYRWGTNSINGRLDEGTYTVWVMNGPYDRSRLDLADYRTISVHLKTPLITTVTRAIPGTLTLTTAPDGASVVIDKTYRGSTPLTIEGLAPGTHTVTFSQFGYFPLSVPVSVRAGEITEVSGTLLPLTGSLEIITSPPEARIQLDSVDQGTSPLTLKNITTGNYTLTVIKEGYGTTVQTVKVLSNQTTQITVPLEPVFSPGSGLFPALGPDPAVMTAGFILVLLVIRTVFLE